MTDHFLPVGFCLQIRKQYETEGYIETNIRTYPLLLQFSTEDLRMYIDAAPYINYYVCTYLRLRCRVRRHHPPHAFGDGDAGD